VAALEAAAARASSAQRMPQIFTRVRRTVMPLPLQWWKTPPTGPPMPGTAQLEW
jgi:hypothetical protein